MRIHDEVTLPNKERLGTATEGRSYIAVIGIDRYHTWSRLNNAVSDARGAMDLFLRLGFDLISPPLFDGQATGAALHQLVTNDLTRLGKQDSLVVFFAGHGHTVTRTFLGGASVSDGYLVPVDGCLPRRSSSTWIRLESWLKDITRLPAQHILVILDACHSGLALGSIIQNRIRGLVTPTTGSIGCIEQLHARRSRRIITSALDDQVAMDSGPVPGHSLFTGCLIEALTTGLGVATGETTVTGSQLGLYVQRRVSEYQSSLQTPDFGTLELDNRGELMIHIPPDLMFHDSGIPEEIATIYSAIDLSICISSIPKQFIDLNTIPEPTPAELSIEPAGVILSLLGTDTAPEPTPLTLPDYQQHATPSDVDPTAPSNQVHSESSIKAIAKFDVAMFKLRRVPRAVIPLALAVVFLVLAIGERLLASAMGPAEESDASRLSGDERPPVYHYAYDAGLEGSALNAPAARAAVSPSISAIMTKDEPTTTPESAIPLPSQLRTCAREIAHVPLFCDNGLAFSVYENNIKLFDGPGNLEVPIGQHRAIIVKVRGFHDKALMVDSAMENIVFHVQPLTPKQDCTKRVDDPTSEACVVKYCATHPENVDACPRCTRQIDAPTSAICVAKYCAKHPEDSKECPKCMQRIEDPSKLACVATYCEQHPEDRRSCSIDYEYWYHAQ